MSLTPKSEVREVSEISEADKLQIRAFLQGAVYSWCKNRPNEWFAMRDLMGGENSNWDGTPLEALYRKHYYIKKKDHDTSLTETAKDSGWLLKKVIDEDIRIFDTEEKGLVRQYKWVNKP